MEKMTFANGFVMTIAETGIMTPDRAKGVCGMILQGMMDDNGVKFPVVCVALVDKTPETPFASPKGLDLRESVYEIEDAIMPKIFFALNRGLDESDRTYYSYTEEDPVPYGDGELLFGAFIGPTFGNEANFDARKCVEIAEGVMVEWFARLDQDCLGRDKFVASCVGPAAAHGNAAGFAPDKNYGDGGVTINREDAAETWRRDLASVSWTPEGEDKALWTSACGRASMVLTFGAVDHGEGDGVEDAALVTFTWRDGAISDGQCVPGLIETASFRIMDELGDNYYVDSCVKGGHGWNSETNVVTHYPYLPDASGLISGGIRIELDEDGQDDFVPALIESVVADAIKPAAADMAAALAGDVAA